MALTILGLSGAVSHDPSAALYIDGKPIGRLPLGRNGHMPEVQCGTLRPQALKMPFNCRGEPMIWSPLSASDMFLEPDPEDTVVEAVLVEMIAVPG